MSRAWLIGVAAIAIASGLAAGVPAGAAEGRAPCGKTRILWLADSHALGPFGDHVGGWLEDRPDTEVQTWAMGGSSPDWWFRGNIAEHGYHFDGCAPKPHPRRRNLQHKRLATPKIASLLDAPEGRYEREVVIVMQGSNLPGLPSIYEEGATRLVKAIHAKRARTCVWIAPPKLRDRKERLSDQVYAAIDAGIQAAAKDGAPCHLVDSRPLSDYPRNEGDGVHYPFTKGGVAAARRWGDGVIAALEPILASPPRPPP